MTPEQIEQERAAFEAWYIKYGNYTEQDKCLYLCRNTNTNMYTIPHIQDLWRGWRARAEQTGWISVEDELPEQTIACIVWNKTYQAVQSACFSADEQVFRIIAGEEITEDITHWQPLPQPPEGEAA